MHKNYFFLNREIVELNEQLIGYKIPSIFSQFKDHLLINCIKNDQEKYLEISTNPGEPYIHLRDNFYRAKKNTVDIFDIDSSAEITSFEIAKNDRIIKIVTDRYKIYFPIRGKYTNVYLFDNKRIQTFKKTDEEIISAFKDEVKVPEFITTYRNLDFINDYNKKDVDIIRKKYPIISKDIILEYKSRCTDEGKFLNASLLKEVIKDIQQKQSACFVDEYNYQIKISVDGFKSLSVTKKFLFDNYQEALGYLLSKKKFLRILQKNKRIIEKYLSKELEYITSKLNKLKAVLENGDQSDKYKNLADLLLINISSIKKRMEEIELTNFEGQQITIKLDKKLSAKKNIDIYYSKSRGEKIRFENAKKDFKSSNKRLSFLREIERQYQSVTELSELEIILNKLNLKKYKKKNTKESMTSKFRTYLIDDKFYVYVGKDGKTNDMLTTKFAKQNDIWFHVRGLPGSHVVLRITDKKSKPPKSIIKIAATVAAFHSKAKTAGLVPVSYAQKKYVIKKKGMASGKVLMLKEETVLVRPEIPKNCVFLSQSD